MVGFPYHKDLNKVPLNFGNHRMGSCLYQGPFGGFYSTGARILQEGGGGGGGAKHRDPGLESYPHLRLIEGSARKTSSALRA